MQLWALTEAGPRSIGVLGSEAVMRLGAVEQQLRQSPALAVYRWFADLPAFDGLSAGSTCVWFVDLRFLTPGRDRMPFRWGVCRSDAGASWRLAIS